jgi:hypothetical protein
MMTDLERTMVGILTVIFLLGGAGVAMYGIFQVNSTGDKSAGDQFIIPSQILNSLTVIFLLYLTMNNSYMSNSYKFLIILLLVGGVVAEIYITGYSDQSLENTLSYVVIVLNFLIRVFFVVELSKNGVTSPIITPLQPMQKAVKEAVVRPMEQAIKRVVEPAPAPRAKQESAEEDYGKMIISKWDSIWRKIKASPEGLDEESRKQAWNEVVNPASKEGRKDVMGVIKEAISKLKDSSGNPIPQSILDTIGGARK